MKMAQDLHTENSKYYEKQNKSATNDMDISAKKTGEFKRAQRFCYRY